MKIGLSATTLEPWYKNGRPDGIGIYTKHLLDGLVGQGEEAVPLTFPSFTRSGRPVVGRPLSTPFPVAVFGAAVAGRLARLRPPVDVYHATDYRIVPMSCPVVATLFDAIPMIDPSMSNQRLRTLKNYLMRKMAGYADVVVAISAYSVAELVEHYRIAEDRIRVVHCGVDADWLDRPEPEFVDRTLATHGLRPGYFLSVGTLQPRKNVERIVAAHALLPEAMRRERPLVVVGRRGWRCDAVVELLQRKEARGEVRWLPGVADTMELRALYAAAGTFVFPSLHEGFGLPVLEAFASGVPVVTSNTTSLPEVSAGIAWEVDPRSVEAIAGAMEESFADETERLRRIEAGRERARAMGWDAMTERMRGIYRELR